MTEIRKQMSRWSQTTYEATLQDRLEHGHYKSDRTAEIAKYVLKAQNIANKPMTGYSTNGLNKIEMEVGNFKYVKVFNIVQQLKDWTPMDMVYGTCFLALRDPMVKECAQRWGMSEEELITKMCGRALRALPSYIREHDLKNQLEKQFPTTEFKQSEALDTILHADLMMERNGNNYYFWSFVNTEKSMQNFQDKFLGHRQGMIPDGYHVVCPFALNHCDDVDGWKLYDHKYLESITQVIENKTDVGYQEIESILDSNDRYFAKPRLVTKMAERELEIEEDLDIELAIGNR